MKILGNTDMDISYGQRCIVTIEISQCSYYGNIVQLLCQIFCVLIELKNYLMNLHEVFRESYT